MTEKQADRLCVARKLVWQIELPPVNLFPSNLLSARHRMICWFSVGCASFSSLGENSYNTSKTIWTTEGRVTYSYWGLSRAIWSGQEIVQVIWQYLYKSLSMGCSHSHCPSGLQRWSGVSLGSLWSAQTNHSAKMKVHLITKAGTIKLAVSFKAAGHKRRLWNLFITYSSF